MMKKLLPLSAVTVAIMLSGHAYAADGEAANLPADGIITPILCSVLDNNVTVQTSKGVQAVFNCSTTTFTAATCHAQGTNKSTTQDCKWTTTTTSNADGTTSTVTTVNFSACGTTAPADGSTKKITYQGRIGFKGGSGGGTVGATELLQPTCDATTAKTLVPTP